MEDKQINLSNLSSCSSFSCFWNKEQKKKCGNELHSFSSHGGRDVVVEQKEKKEANEDGKEGKDGGKDDETQDEDEILLKKKDIRKETREVKCEKGTSSCSSTAGNISTGEKNKVLKKEEKEEGKNYDVVLRHMTSLPVRKEGKSSSNKFIKNSFKEKDGEERKNEEMEDEQTEFSKEIQQEECSIEEQEKLVLSKNQEEESRRSDFCRKLIKKMMEKLSSSLSVNSITRKEGNLSDIMPCLLTESDADVACLNRGEEEEKVMEEEEVDKKEKEPSRMEWMTEETKEEKMKDGKESKNEKKILEKKKKQKKEGGRSNIEKEQIKTSHILSRNHKLHSSTSHVEYFFPSLSFLLETISPSSSFPSNYFFPSEEEGAERGRKEEREGKNGKRKEDGQESRGKNSTTSFPHSIPDTYLSSNTLSTSPLLLPPSPTSSFRKRSLRRKNPFFTTFSFLTMTTASMILMMVSGTVTSSSSSSSSSFSSFPSLHSSLPEGVKEGQGMERLRREGKSESQSKKDGGSDLSPRVDLLSLLWTTTTTGRYLSSNRDNLKLHNIVNHGGKQSVEEGRSQKSRQIVGNKMKKIKQSQNQNQELGNHMIAVDEPERVSESVFWFDTFGVNPKSLLKSASVCVFLPQFSLSLNEIVYLSAQTKSEFPSGKDEGVGRRGREGERAFEKSEKKRSTVFHQGSLVEFKGKAALI